MGLNLSQSLRGSVPGRVTLPPLFREGSNREGGNARHPWPVAIPGQAKKPGTGTLWITQENPAMAGPVAVLGAFPFWCLLTGNAGNGGKSGLVEQSKPVEHLILLRSRLTAPDRECDCRLWFVAGGDLMKKLIKFRPQTLGKERGLLHNRHSCHH